MRPDAAATSSPEAVLREPGSAPGVAVDSVAPLPGDGRSRSSGPDLPRSLLLGAACAGLAWLSIGLWRESGQVASLWFANALGCAALAQWRPRRWAAPLAAVALGLWLANRVWGVGAAEAGVYALANVAETALAALLLRWQGLQQASLRSPGELMRLLLLGGVLPPLVGASLAVLGQGLLQPSPTLADWLPWFMGSVVGAVALLPLALLLMGQPWPRLQPALSDPRLAWVLPLAMGLSLLCMAQLRFPYIYVQLPLVLCALLLRVPAVALASVLVAACMAVAEATGAFVPPPVLGLWEQAFVRLAPAGVLLPALLLATVLAQLREQQARLQERSQELEHANQGLRQFVHMASHDLREPLNTVTQFTDLVLSDHGHQLPGASRQWLGLVQREAGHMRSLLDDVLEFSQVQRNELPPPVPVDLNGVLAAVQQQLAPVWAQRQARLHCAGLPVVKGHPAQLALLLRHLLDNGSKFVPPGRQPVLHLSCHTDAGWACLQLQDNGIGIAAADLPRLFKPFQRLHLRRDYDGTGLGLALCRQVVRLHGGRIALDSAPGQGTQVQVWLPLAPGQTGDEATEPPLHGPID